MLDVAWPELIVIGVVALVAIGPKDLPKVMRVLGQWTSKARKMTREFRTAFDQLNYETEINEKLKNGTAKPPEPVMTPVSPSDPATKPDV